MDLQSFIDESGALASELGAAFYFDPITSAAGEAIGLDVLTFYALGRAGVMGDPESSVISSAFGYFKPTIVDFLWQEGKAKVDPRTAAQAHLAAAHAFAEQYFAGIDELEAFCGALERVVIAHERGSSPLFAAYASLPLPAEPVARAYQLVVTLRELRGGSHLAAIVASGLEPRVAHFIARPDMFTTFGWSNDDVPEVGNAEIEAMSCAQDLTDRLVAPSLALLSSEDREVVLRVLRAMRAAWQGEVIPADLL